MKRHLFIITTFIIFYSNNISDAQIPAWQWAKTAAGNISDEGYGIAVDANGYSYVTGFFQSSPISFGSIVLNCAGGYDIFIAKYDPAGNIVWAVSAGGASDDKGLGIAVDAGGNSYVTGNFQSSSITFGSTTLLNAGAHDIFIAKYDSNGTVIWAKSVGGSSNELCGGIAADSSGNCYATGTFGSPLITFGATTLTNQGGDDMFIVKYNSIGNVDWAKSSGGNNSDMGIGIAVDASGNSFVTGAFVSSSIMFGSTTLYQAGSQDVFVVKYDTAGNVVWAKSAGGTLHDLGSGIAVDGNGNCFITGYFRSPSITFGSTTFGCAGIYDMFIAKYNSSGNVLWAKHAGGNLNDGGFGIAADANGNCYAIGSFCSSSITLGGSTFANASPGVWDMYLVKYDAGGTMLWAKTVGGNSNDRCYGVAVDSSGNAHVTGFFQSSVMAFGTNTLNNPGTSENIFVAKLGTAPPAVNLASSDTSWCEKKCINFFDLSTNNATSWQWFFPGADSTSSTLQNPTNICYNTYGSFDVTLIACNGAGCDTITLTNFINEFVSPTDSIWGLNDTLWSLPFPSYQWYEVTNGLIPGATNSYFVPAQSGSYYCVVDDTIGCVAASNVITITGISENTVYNSQITISPNPFSNSTAISFSLTESQNVSLQIFDVNGKLVSTLSNEELAAGEHQIEFNAEKIDAGIYFLKMQAGEFIETKKLSVIK